MALVFFGPRKLPQISRSLGKNLAEFRRASEDFKRTWDREVSLEDATSGPTPAHNISSNPESASLSFPSPSIAAIAPDQVIARNTIGSDPLNTSNEIDLAPDASAVENLRDEPNHSPKNDWL
jgi:Sec-independent protein translocase protein TatA